jgi:hypothetical protein
MYTRLDIINSMIGATGARLLTAEQDRHPSYMKAERMLNRVRVAIQSSGLWFNTECRVIDPQEDGTITVPQNCIKADPADRHYNLTLRGSKMYDLNTGSFYVGGAVRMNMHFDIDLDDMPISAKEYLRARATYEYYLSEDGTDPKLSNYRNERDTGWQTLYKENIRNRQENMYDNPSNTVNKLRRGYTTTSANNGLIKFV